MNLNIYMGNKAVQFQSSIIAVLNLFTHLFNRNERTATQTICSDAFFFLPAASAIALEKLHLLSVRRQKAELSLKGNRESLA